MTATLEQFSIDFEEIAKKLGYTAANMEEGVIAAMEQKRLELIGKGYTKDQADEIVQLAKDASEAATKVKTFTQLISTLREAAQSGWTQTWEYIIGDFEEAKTILTDISDYFGRIINISADTRNQIFKEWRDSGGRDMLWNKDPEKGPLGVFWNVALGIQNILSSIKKAFQSIFPPLTSKSLLAITETIQKVTAKFRELTENTEKLSLIQRIAAGIAAAFRIVGQMVNYVWAGVKKVFSFLSPILGIVVERFAAIGDKLVALKDGLKVSKELQGLFQSIGVILTWVQGKIIGAVQTAFQKIDALFAAMKNLSVVKTVGDAFKSAFLAVSDWFSRISEHIQNGTKTAGEFIKESLSPIKKWFADTYGSIEAWFKGVYATVIGSPFFKTIQRGAQTASEWLGRLWGSIANAESWAKIGNDISAAYSKVIEVMKNLKDGAVLWFQNLFSKPKDAKGAANAGNALSETIAKVSNGLVKFKSAFSGFIDRIKSSETLSKLWQSLKGWLAPILSWLRDFGSRIREGITRAFSAAVDESGGPLAKIKKMGEAFGSAFTGWFDSVKTGITNAWNDVKGYLTTFFREKIPSFFKNVQSVAGPLFEKAEPVLWKTLGAAALFNVLKTIKNFSKIGEIPSAIKNFSSSIKDIGSAFKTVVKNGGKITKDGIFFNGKDPNKLKNIANSILKIAGAVGILAGSIYLLSTMNEDGLKRGVGTLSFVIAELVLVSALLGKKIENRGFKDLALSLIIMVGSIKLLSYMPFDTLLNGMSKLGLIMLLLAGYTKLANKDFTGKDAGFFGLAAAVLVLVGAIKLLGSMKLKDLGKGLAGLGGILFGLAVFTKTVPEKKIKGFLGLAIGVGLMAVALSKIGKLNTKTLIKGLVGLGGIMLAFAGMSKLMSGANVAGTALMLIAMVGSMYLMSEIFAKMSGLDADSVLKIATSLSEIMLAMGIVIAVLSKVPITGSLSAVAGISVFILGLGALIVGLGALQAQWSGLTGFLESGGDVLQQLGKAIGKFVGGIGQGALESLSKGLAAYSENIKGLGDAENKKDIDASVAIAKGLAELSNAIKPDGLGDWILALAGRKTAFERFIDAVGPFGTAMGAYATAVEDFSLKLNEDNQQQIIMTAQGLIGLAKAVPDAGILESLKLIPNDFDAFIKSIGPFGVAMNAYAAAIENFSKKVQTSTQTQVVSAATGLIALAKAVPEANVLENLGFIPTNFETFIKAIGPFGKAISAYAAGISNISAGITDKDQADALGAITKIKDFAETLDPSGSIWDSLDKAFGQGSKINTLFSYTNAMGNMGTNIKTFVTSLQDIDSINPNDAIVLVNKIRDFVNGLEESDGAFSDLWQWAVGGNKMATLDTIMQSMGNFGNNFKAFTDGISEAGSGKINFELAKQMFEAFRALKIELAESGGYQGSGLAEMQTIMSDMGWAISDFNTIVMDVSVDSLTAAASLIASVGQLAVAMSALPDADTVKIQTMLDNLSNITIPQMDTEGIESAKAFVTSLTEGIVGASALASMVTAIRDLSGGGVNAAEGTYGVWYTSGQYLASGLGNGIRSMESSVRSAAVNVASGAIRSIQTAWSIHSPSRVGEDLGMYFDLGLANGLYAYSKAVSGQASNIGQSVVDSASTMLRGVDGSIFDNLDPNPTIRPVLDLSNVRNGIGAINGMLNTTPKADIFEGVNIRNNMSALHMDGASIKGRLSDRNILDRLDILQERIGQLGESISNMKIVLDSGVLVGETSMQMDNRLGLLAMRRSRGN